MDNKYYIKICWSLWLCPFGICKMGMSGLPDMYTRSRGPQAQGLRLNISGRPQAVMLQILCNTFNYICSVAYTFALWFSVTYTFLIS